MYGSSDTHPPSYCYSQRVLELTENPVESRNCRNYAPEEAHQALPLLLGAAVLVFEYCSKGVCVCDTILLLVKERPEYLPEEPRQVLENGYHKAI